MFIQGNGGSWAIILDSNNLGTVVHAGTIFNAGSGYTYIVIADGSTTNLNTGYTYGANHNNHHDNFNVQVGDNIVI